MKEWFSIYKVEMAFRPPVFVAWLYTTRLEATSLATTLVAGAPAGGTANVILDRSGQFIVPQVPGGFKVPWG